MTSPNKNQFYGPPPPITQLTMEQDLQMRVLEDKLEAIYNERKKDIITLFLALQRQNFVMGNSIRNLVDHWPHEEIVFIHPGEGVPLKIQYQE
tara:strand:- start:277 stop:555 length:279 start_codon:yes stop_codon:yes gene_type:complete